MPSMHSPGRQDWRPPFHALRWLMICSLAAFSAGGFAADLLPPNALGLRVASGFAARLYADTSLADDIYSMAVNPRGQIVVSGRGYIRTLLDTDGNGAADRFVEFGETRTGGMGLCFVGNDLLFVGDGALWRIRDADGDNRADGPAERVIDLPFAEHGGHAVRRGPDGALYVMVGNETKLAGWHGPFGPTGSQPIEGGALLRVTPDNPGGSRVIAQGFRNAYDFDFNNDGELFTYDSDAEADFLLPWYTPTRLIHIAPGGHHGWRLDGWTRSWARPDYSPDTVEILAPLGRGSPTGVACYRHLQFPESYRDGLFALDWTFGRVYFAELEADGASYTTRPQVFLESSGSAGFAPTDVVVGWDGALFLSTGGRRARGAVYRIDYVGNPLLPELATNWMTLVTSEEQAVLDAPEPLEEWSRRLWVGLALRLGPGPFNLAATDDRVTNQRRVRAIEILTEFHGGLASPVALNCARGDSSAIRARVAWSMSVRPSGNAALILSTLARDVDAGVRQAALEALRNLVAEMPPATLQSALGINLAHPDRRVRQSAALLATWLPEPAWKSLVGQLDSLPLQARLTLLVAIHWRTSPTAVDARAIDRSLAALKQARTLDLQLDCVRLIIGALGDCRLRGASAEVFTGYESAYSLTDSAMGARIEQAVRPLFPAGSRALNLETSRLLAMIQATNTTLPARLLANISPSSDVAMDFHLLATVARLGANLPATSIDRAAQAIVGLDRKINAQARGTKQNWTVRLQEVVRRLIERSPDLATALARQPELVRPGNLPLVSLLGPAQRANNARAVYAAVQRTVGYPWSVELVDLLATLPDKDVHPLFRRHWSDGSLRDRLILELASAPAPEDRVHLVAGLASPDPRVVQAAAGALLKLPRESASSAGATVATLRALRRFTLRAEDRDTRLPLVWLVNHLTGERFEIHEAGSTNLYDVYQPIFARVAQRIPGVSTQVESDDPENAAKWDALLKTIAWSRGSAERGYAVYQNRGCAGCHESSGTLGPDLAGVANRLAPREVFHAILFPSRDIAPPWQMENFRLTNGESYQGRVTFESSEVLIVQTGLGANVRVDVSQLVRREKSEVSFMPGGLLAGASQEECADLYAWLRTIGQK